MKILLKLAAIAVPPVCGVLFVSLALHVLFPYAFPARLGTDRWVCVSDEAAVKADGSLWEWEGGYFNDRIWEWEKGNFNKRIGEDSDWAYVSSAYGYSLAIKADGSLWVWGRYSPHMYLGAGVPENYDEPVQVGEDYDWKMVVTYYASDVAIKTDGSLWRLTQYEYDTDISYFEPTRTGTDSDWASVSGIAAIKKNGDVWAWGYDRYKREGDFWLSQERTDHMQFAGYRNWVFFGEGAAIDTDGSLWTWSGRLGRALGSGIPWISHYKPERVYGGRRWAAVAKADDYTVAIKKDGSLWAWGRY